MNEIIHIFYDFSFDFHFHFPQQNNSTIYTETMVLSFAHILANDKQPPR